MVVLHREVEVVGVGGVLACRMVGRMEVVVEVEVEVVEVAVEGVVEEHEFPQRTPYLLQEDLPGKVG